MTVLKFLSTAIKNITPRTAFGALVLLTLSLLSSCANHTHSVRVKDAKLTFLSMNSDLSKLSDYTKHFNYGAKLAAKEINSRGGVNGSKIVIKTQNDYLSYLAAANALAKYKYSNILAVFGTTFPSASIGVARAAEAHHIPFLSSGYTVENRYLQSKSYVFNLRPNMIKTLAALVLSLPEQSKKDVNSWLVISSSDPEASSYAKGFRSALDELKTSDRRLVFYNLKVGDFKSGYLQIDQPLKEILSQVKGVLLLVNPRDLQNIIDNYHLASELETKIVLAPFLGDPEWFSYSTKENIPTNWLVTGYPWYKIGAGAHKDFVAKYKEAYGAVPRYSSLLGYMSVYLLAQASAKLDLHHEEDIYTLRENLRRALENVSIQSPLGAKLQLQKDHSSTLGVFIGLSTPYSTIIRAKNGTKMLLKDMRMNDVEYFSTKELLKEEQRLMSECYKKKQKVAETSKVTNIHSELQGGYKTTGGLDEDLTNLLTSPQ